MLQCRGAHHGHYVSLIKSCGRWIVFDDDTVSQIEESEIYKYFGDTPGMGTGYVLFYQAVDLQPARPRPVAADLPLIPASNTLSPSNLSNTKPQLSLNTSTVEPIRPNSNSVPASPDRAAIPSPVKERRGFFNLANRRSISQKPTAWTVEDLTDQPQASYLSPHARSATEGAEPVTPPPLGRSFMTFDGDTTDDESTPSVSSNNLSQSQYSNSDHLRPPASASPVVQPDKKGTLGRLFGRTKSFKRPVSGTFSPETPRTEEMPDLGGGQTSPVLNKKQMKELEKQAEKADKERVKREKEEAKRLRESGRR